jgi:hypothetical protein
VRAWVGIGAALLAIAVLPLMQNAYSHGVSGTFGGGDSGQRANLLPFQVFVNSPSPTGPLIMMWLLIAAFAFGIFVLWKNRAKKLYC